MFYDLMYFLSFKAVWDKFGDILVTVVIFKFLLTPVPCSKSPSGPNLDITLTCKSEKRVYNAKKIGQLIDLY